MFKEAATEGNTVNLEEVLAYIVKCVEDVTATKTIAISPNHKPWLNAEVHHLAGMLHLEQGCRGTQSRSTEPYRQGLTLSIFTSSTCATKLKNLVAHK